MSKLDAAKKAAEKFSKAALKKMAKVGKDFESAVDPVSAAKPDNVGGVARGGVLRQLAELAALPQKVGSQQLAQMAGLKAEDTSEQNFANIADAIGDKLGVPRTSTAGNVVKAGGVALAETFLDLPLNKVGKGIKALPAIAKIADSLGATKKAASAIPTKAIAEAEVAAAQKVAQNLDIKKAADAIRAQKDAAIKNLAEGVKRVEQAPDWQSAYKKKGLRPELQGKDTTELWQDVSKAQANEPTTKLLNKPAPGNVKKTQDKFLEKQGMDAAKKMGASKEDQPILAELFKRFRGGGK